MNFLPLAQSGGSWYSQPHNSQSLWLAIGATFLASLAIMAGLMFAPQKARRPVVWTATFVTGAFYVLMFLWPSPVSRADDDLPRNGIEAVSFWISDFQPTMAASTNVIAAFLLGLGIYSVLRVHITRLMKKQKDWAFSIVLLVSMLAMIVFGYIDYVMREFRDTDAKLLEQANWSFPNYAFDLLFDGLLQQMDAAMFSIIAFFILSAAFRAFRIRSVEATVLMGSALIMILSLMGAVDVPWSGVIDSLTGNNPAHILNNIKINEIANWFQSTLQVPSLRALEFGVGLGALAMGLRLWLGLEKGGVS